MKLIGARQAGARYFLTPEDNCAAAAADIPSGLTLVKVDTLARRPAGAGQDPRGGHGRTAELLGQVRPSTPAASPSPAR